jgi:hypothetical protein
LRDEISNRIPKLAGLIGDLMSEFVQHLLPCCWVSDDGIGNVRLLLLVLIPNASGLLLSFGLALRRR